MLHQKLAVVNAQFGKVVNDAVCGDSLSVPRRAGLLLCTGGRSSRPSFTHPVTGRAGVGMKSRCKNSWLVLSGRRASCVALRWVLPTKGPRRRRARPNAPARFSRYVLQSSHLASQACVPASGIRELQRSLDSREARQKGDGPILIRWRLPSPTTARPCKPPCTVSRFSDGSGLAVGSARRRDLRLHQAQTLYGVQSENLR